MAKNLKEILDFAQAQALANKLWPDDEANWRYFCRAYSKLFNTPYHEVLDMDPELILLAYYENQFDDVDVEENLEKILDMIYSLEDPEYEAQKKEELEDFIEKAELDEEERIKAGKPIHKNMAKVRMQEASLPEPTPDLPKQGFIDLSYLDREESEGGFEE